jgi:EAL and modified HD-GYP domain-containing signal transduction protein
VAILRQFEVKLLAEKVETQEDYAYCKELGFDYFQGYFFCRPNIVKGRHTPSSKLTIMRLLAKINEPNLDFKDLEKLIIHDVSLSYRILRYINSALYSLSNKVESIHRAITLLGLKAIRSWITILAMSKIDDKPYELMMVALSRAKMCETLADQQRLDPNTAFTVGLLSTLDALMDKNLDDLLKDLPLSEEINAALLSFDGPLGKTLHAVLAYERGEWDTALAVSDFSTVDLSDTYLQAIRWSEDTSRHLLEA